MRLSYSSPPTGRHGWTLVDTFTSVVPPFKLYTSPPNSTRSASPRTNFSRCPPSSQFEIPPRDHLRSCRGSMGKQPPLGGLVAGEKFRLTPSCRIGEGGCADMHESRPDDRRTSFVCARGSQVRRSPRGANLIYNQVVSSHNPCGAK